MHYTYKLFIKSFWLVTALLFRQVSLAQSGAAYTNQWIAYDKPYVKIGVTAKGLHRIPFASLPKNFPTNKPENLQLWHRGRQVAIISTANNEVIFYGVPNDGSSDSLLYRPMSSRLNPYFSMYSDESAYFLTMGDAPGSRAKVVNQVVDGKLSSLEYHKEVQTAVFQQQYSLSTAFNVRPDFFNSYFELGVSKTGEFVESGVLLSKNFKLKSFISNVKKPVLKLLVHGRSNNAHNIEIYIGKNAQSLRLVTTLKNFGFEGTTFSFELNPEDIDVEKNGVLALKTVGKLSLDRFSLAFYSITFPQSFQIDGQANKELRLDPVDAPWSKISLKGASAGLTFLDISDADNPTVLKGSPENLMVPRQPKKEQLLLAAVNVINVPETKIRSMTFKSFEAKQPNYIMITTDSLMVGAKQFADYRASKVGGGFKPLIVNIKDIYDQFNYGEPSPLAIKRFMSYMLTEGGKDKYLFLIGKSVTHNEKMRRELPGEVPTIGYPGSDILLVEGIDGTAANVPAIPVGRLSAVTNQQIINYLQKVKDYENQSNEIGWRKNIIQISGGKTTEEITQLKELLHVLEPAAHDGVIGGTIKTYVKQQAMAEVEAVNIAADVNNGAGLITFFGHGAPYRTDPDIGFITDPQRNYNNPHKYPMMYFNGCGVGNIFSDRFNSKPASPSSADRITLSLDWLLTPDKGAIAIVANSFESYVGPAATYLQKLYHYMFINPATTDLSIGKIQQAVAQDIVSNYKDEFSIANVHQSLLQGDPALRLVTVPKPDYAVDPDQSISISSQSPDKTMGASDSLKINVLISNGGRFTSGQRVPVMLTCFGKKGNVVKEQILPAFPSQRNWQVTLLNSKDIQRIRVELDREKSISELNEDNNVAEIEINWNQVKDKTTFSYVNVKDIIPPLLDVTFNDRLLQKDEVLGANPTINIALTDDRRLLSDTSLIEIFIKNCADDDCDFEKMAYPASDIVMDAAGNRSLHLSLKSRLNKGIYEMLVNARDRAGNAIAQPYRIRFEIKEKEEPDIELVVSPNPASSYLRFELKSGKQLDLKSVRCLIYNAQGILVEEKNIDGSVLSLKKGWYWFPGSQAAGLYAYKVTLYDQGNAPIETRTGKVVILK